MIAFKIYMSNSSLNCDDNLAVALWSETLWPAHSSSFGGGIMRVFMSSDLSCVLSCVLSEDFSLRDLAFPHTVTLQ